MLTIRSDIGKQIRVLASTLVRVTVAIFVAIYPSLQVTSIYQLILPPLNLDLVRPRSLFFL